MKLVQTKHETDCILTIINKRNISRALRFLNKRNSLEQENKMNKEAEFTSCGAVNCGCYRSPIYALVMNKFESFEMPLLLSNRSKQREIRTSFLKL
uniref:Uncharacterized protein n=1 Tax=Solanum tuberosum TaxID=4113 RepID=M1D4B7_SOLTU